MILIYLLALAISFYLLAIICDEFFVESLNVISKKLKISSEVAGATFMAIGSSAPEFFTSLIALFHIGNHADIGSGTIVGSAIFNILVIIGASVMFRRATLSWQPVIRDLLFYSLSIILLLISFRDGRIVLGEAFVFVIFYIIYVYTVTQWSKWLNYKTVDPAEETSQEIQKNTLSHNASKLLGLIIPRPNKSPNAYLATFSLSVILIGLLSFTMVESAIKIGHLLHISPAIIALTVLAAGTSIPDLISSVIVAKKGRADMAVSNAIGSNIFDILFGLGFPWIIVLLLRQKEVTISSENLTASIILLFATVIAVLFLLIIRKWSIGKKSGFILIAIYLIYLIYNIQAVI